MKNPSCCFLNTNTATIRQLIRTARTLEAEWWQVCGEAWVCGQRKTSQVLGVLVLLDFTMLQPVLTWCVFWNLWTVYFFNFPFFFAGRGQPRILNPRIRRSTCICSYSMSEPLQSTQEYVEVLVAALYDHMRATLLTATSITCCKMHPRAVAPIRSSSK
jgi:hypothetical protein